MSAISLTVPHLKEAAAAMVKDYFHGAVANDFDSLISYSYKKDQFNVKIISRIRGGEEWHGVGTVVLVRQQEVFVYKGYWNPNGKMTVSSFESDLVTFDGATGKVKYLPEGLSFSLEFDDVNVVDAVDDTHVKCAGTKVEFPLVPDGELRMLGPDGDHLFLNEDVSMTKEEMEHNILREESGIKIYQISRSTLVRGLDGTGIELSLTVSKGGVDLYWYHYGYEKNENVEFSFFKYWLENPDAPRNLIRAMGVKIPDPKKVDAPVQATTTS